MAKKNTRDNERRAIAEQMRRDQARKERRRSLLILGACMVVVLGLLAAAVIPYVSKIRSDNKLAGTPLDELGASASAASCSAATTKKATGNNQHLTIGQKIPYADAPPASGPHWGNFLQGSEIRNFYTVDDRPQLERMVHSLEHGHTLVWYDDTVKPGTKDYAVLKKIADRISPDSYFMAVPWKSSDGKAFPSGKHVAMTHWTGPEDQKGVTQYCGKPSGAAVQDFMKKYPKTDTPEPGAA